MNYRSKIFILSGIYALLAIFISKQLVLNYSNAEEGVNMIPMDLLEMVLYALAIVTFLMNLLTISFFVKRSTYPLNFKKRFHFLIPSILGWIIIFLLLRQNMIMLVVPVSLIIFGLILLNLNRFVTSRLVYFGVSLVLLGVISFFLPSQNWLFLILGFGIFPILFGLILMRKSKTQIEP